MYGRIASRARGRKAALRLPSLDATTGITKTVATGSSRSSIATRTSSFLAAKIVFPKNSSSTINSPLERSFSLESDAPGKERVISQGTRRIDPDVIPTRPWHDKRSLIDTRVKEFVEAPLGSLAPHAIKFDALDLAEQCCKLRDFVGMRFAHDILDRALAEKSYVDAQVDNTLQNSRPFLVPLSLFQKIIFGWSTMAQQGKIAQVRMRELMDLVLTTAQNDADRFKHLIPPKKFHLRQPDFQMGETNLLKPTTNIYNTYLTGLSNAAKSSHSAATTSRAVLNEMMQLHGENGWFTKPNTKSFGLVTSAFANSGKKDAGTKAEKVLRLLQRIHQREKKAYEEEYGIPYNTRDPTQNKRKIPTADNIIYNNVLQAYSSGRSMMGALKAKDLLIEIVAITDGTVQPDLGIYTGVIASFASVAENIRISKEDRATAAQDAESILQVLIEDMKELGGTYQQGKQLSLVAPFNACMNAHAKSGAPASALKAEALLQRMLFNLTNGKSNVTPDTISFNTVYDAWSRCAGAQKDAPVKAEELLRLHIELIESGVLDETSKPDGQSYGLVMTAYARSKRPNKVQDAYRLLLELLNGIENNKIPPSGSLLVAFTTILNAAAHTKPAKDRTRSLESTVDGASPEASPFNQSVNKMDGVYSIALQIYREAKDGVHKSRMKPDHIFFAAMLHVIGVHTERTSAERRQMVQLVFQDACGLGEVSKLVLKSLYSACPDKNFLNSLLRSEDLAYRIQSVDELPRSWTRNVPHKYRYLRI